MIVKLRDIPESGKSWDIAKQKDMIKPKLADLIGPLDVSGNVWIQPLPGLEGQFELRGQIQGFLPENCSRCDLEFEFPFEEKFQEVLTPKIPMERDSKESRVNHLSDIVDSEVGHVHYQGDVFDLGEYLHELVALSRPFNPAPPCDAQDKCSKCGLSTKEHNFGYEESLPEKESPFALLQKLKTQFPPQN
jgi:uncharacterized protein